MVTHTRTPNRPRRTVVEARPPHRPAPAGDLKVAPTAAPKLSPLNQPRLIDIETDNNGVPTNIVVSKSRRAVESILETWRIDDEWWRAQPITRTYWRLFLEDGRTVDVYRDHARDKWFRQAYAG